MSARSMDKLKMMLCKELDEVAEKGTMTAGDLEMVHKLTDTIKNIHKIKMLDEAGYSEYSERRYSMDGFREGQMRPDGSYYRSNMSRARGSYDGGGSYDSYADSHNSYRRGRSYSGSVDAEEELMEILREGDLDPQSEGAVKKALESVRANK